MKQSGTKVGSTSTTGTRAQTSKEHICKPNGPGSSRGGSKEAASGPYAPRGRCPRHLPHHPPPHGLLWAQTCLPAGLGEAAAAMQSQRSASRKVGGERRGNAAEDAQSMRACRCGREKGWDASCGAPVAVPQPNRRHAAAEEEHDLLEHRGLLHLVGACEVRESPRQPGRLEDRETRLKLLRRKRTRAKVSDVRAAPNHRRCAWLG